METICIRIAEIKGSSAAIHIFSVSYILPVNLSFIFEWFQGAVLFGLLGGDFMAVTVLLCKYSLVAFDREEIF